VWLEYFASLPFGAHLTHLELDAKCAQIYRDAMAPYADVYAAHEGDQADAGFVTRVMREADAAFGGKNAFGMRTGQSGD
jgi:hypothetical protein